MTRDPEMIVGPETTVYIWASGFREELLNVGVKCSGTTAAGAKCQSLTRSLSGLCHQHEIKAKEQKHTGTAGIAAIGYCELDSELASAALYIKLTDGTELHLVGENVTSDADGDYLVFSNLKQAS